jgi:hypothetical protein
MNDTCEIGMIPGYHDCSRPAVDTIVWVDDDLYNVCAVHAKDFQ